MDNRTVQVPYLILVLYNSTYTLALCGSWRRLWFRLWFGYSERLHLAIISNFIRKSRNNLLVPLVGAEEEEAAVVVEVAALLLE